LTSDDQQLRDKARLLLQRERELFELRLKQEQIGVWLSIGQALPALFSGRDGSLARAWDGIRKLMVGRLRLQRVLLLDVRSDELHALSPAGPPRSMPAAARALLEAQPTGYCNEPNGAAPGVMALAEVLGLHRFMWSCIARSHQAPILLAAGFDATKAVFQSPFAESDVAHFGNAAQLVQSLLGNALLIAELEGERNQLRAANESLEERDRELRRAAEHLRQVNESLEQRVRDRTRELAGRNRELRLVLDTVDQALLTVDLQGRLAPERSRTADAWFGAYTDSPKFVEHVAADERFRVLFALGLEGLREDMLPRELCLAQMPTRLERGARQFDCRYLTVEEHGELLGLLLVIDDVTEHLARAREDAAQRELLAAFVALMRDRNGFSMFCDESERILEELMRESTDRAKQKRLLHTFKGNAATMGLQLLFEICHIAETELARGESCQQSLRRLGARWTEIRHTLRGVAAEQLRSAIEISEQDIASLQARAGSGMSALELVDEIRRLRWESSERHLGRLAQHAQALAARLGKAALEVEIDADDARLEPGRWAPFWSEVVHVVRNAVDHGIEDADERATAGKPRAGKLRLATRRVGGSGYRVEVEDDGRGIDWQAIRERCAQRGRPLSTRADLVEAMLSPDFSTRDQVTDTSGRGMGLASLANVVRELGGHVEVTSETGQGSRWVIAFPNLEASEDGPRQGASAFEQAPRPR